MASLINEPNGRKTIQFSFNRKRPKLSLGKVSERNAITIKHKVEDLLAAARHGTSWSLDLAAWVAELPDGFAERLARVGLIPKKEHACLAPFVDEYITSRTDLKPLTIAKLSTTRDYLVDFFGREKPLREIVPGDADDWRLHLLAKNVSEVTARKHTQIAIQLFRAAQRKKLITENPFASLPSTGQANPNRMYFVNQQTASRVVDACPNAEWRLIFALARYGGLRIPSELVGLTWSDILWGQDRFVVRSPKTERHPGQGSRTVPLFPELRPYLEDMQELAPTGEDSVFLQLQGTSGKNLGTQMKRIIRRAGLDPWPKTFQNLRSSRQTELEEHFPTHVVCKWLGNSPKVANKSYLQVTEDHFRQAVQNLVQHPPESTSERQNVLDENADFSEECGQLRGLATAGIAEEGLEPPTRGL